jgi:hypothetical protein
MNRPKFAEHDRVMIDGEALPLTVQTVHTWPGAETRYTIVAACVGRQYTVSESALRGAA